MNTNDNAQNAPETIWIDTSIIDSAKRKNAQIAGLADAATKIAMASRAINDAMIIVNDIVAELAYPAANKEDETAKQSAKISEEMRLHGETLRELLSHFRIRDDAAEPDGWQSTNPAAAQGSL